MQNAVFLYETRRFTLQLYFLITQNKITNSLNIIIDSLFNF